MSEKRRAVVFGIPIFAHRAKILLEHAGYEAVVRAPRPIRTPRTIPAEVRALFGDLLTTFTSDFILLIGGTDRLGAVIRAASRWRPIFVQWVGSDVVSSAPQARASMRRRPKHWTDAPWLRDELRDVGISAEVLPLVDIEVMDTPPPLPPNFAVAVYLPDRRPEFYWRSRIAELAASIPEVEFVLLATDDVTGFPCNTTAVGWNDNVQAVLERVVVLLRLTDHDGLSHMVAESLALGRYVVWNQRYPGVIEIESIAQARAVLLHLFGEHSTGRLTTNSAGHEHALSELSRPKVVRNLLRALSTSDLSSPRRGHE